MSNSKSDDWMDEDVPVYYSPSRDNRDLIEASIDAFSEYIEPTEDGHGVLDLDEVDHDSMPYDDIFGFYRKFILGGLSAWCRHQDDFSEDCIVTIRGGPQDAQILSELKTSDLGSLVKMNARVMDTTPRKTNRLKVWWECQCGCNETASVQDRASTGLDKPARCTTKGVRDKEEDEECGAPIVKKAKMPQAIKREVQQIVLAECDEDDRNARKIVGEVDEPLIDEVERNDVVTIWADPIVPDEEKQKSDLYLHIVGMELEDGEDIEVTEEDVERIEKIAEEAEDAAELVSKSIAPEIVDRDGMHDRSLLALGCSLVGGNDAYDGRIHTALIGEPGTGKSHMIRRAKDVINGYYVDMSNATKAGLAGAISYNSLIQDEDTVVLEAGAIPRANESVLALDELDKCHIETQDALNLPMEHGEINVTKHGDGELNACTTIMAAANPVKERFDMSQDIIEQQPLKDSVFSRFDLTVVLKNKIAKEADTEREHEMEKLRRQRGEFPFEVIDEDLLAKYIKHASELEPSWSEPAENLVVDKLVDLRMAVNKVATEGMQVSGRVRNSLISLSEALTKLRLGDTVTPADVERAFELMAECWADLTTDHLPLDSLEDIAVARSLASSPSQREPMQQAFATLRLHEDYSIDESLLYDGVDAEPTVIGFVLDKLENQGHIRRDGEQVEVIDLPNGGEAA